MIKTGGATAVFCNGNTRRRSGAVTMKMDTFEKKPTSAGHGKRNLGRSRRLVEDSIKPAQRQSRPKKYVSKNEEVPGEEKIHSIWAESLLLNYAADTPGSDLDPLEQSPKM